MHAPFSQTDASVGNGVSSTDDSPSLPDFAAWIKTVSNDHRFESIIDVGAGCTDWIRLD